VATKFVSDFAVAKMRVLPASSIRRLNVAFSNQLPTTHTLAGSTVRHHFVANRQTIQVGIGIRLSGNDMRITGPVGTLATGRF
jgi:hypothetical protein